MARNLALAVAAVLAVGLLVDFLFESDRERVEAILERIALLAREGGPGAADEIRGYLAPDLRTDLPVERVLERWIARGEIEEVRLGNFKTVPAGDTILVPILRADVRTKTRSYTGIRSLTFEKRAGRWLLAKITRVEFGQL